MKEVWVELTLQQIFFAFGIDNVSVFQGVKSSVTKQFERHALY
jgi:hypothetical protein